MALPEPKLDTDAKLSSLPDVSLVAEAPSTASPTDLPVESLAQLSAALSLLHPGEGDLAQPSTRANQPAAADLTS